MPPPRWVSTEGIVQWGLHEDCDWDRAPWEAAANATDDDNGTADAPISPRRDSSGTMTSTLLHDRCAQHTYIVTVAVV
jgi:hypothetical protein